MQGYENTVLSDRFNDHTGIRTTVSLEGHEAIVNKAWDAAPHLAHAEHARQSTAGQRWGEGKLIGHIPPAFYAQILVIRDPIERKAAVKRFFQQNPAFVMFDRYNK